MKVGLAVSQPSTITAGLDLSDKYSHLCRIDTQTGKVLEEAALPHPQSPPEAFLRLRVERRRPKSGSVPNLNDKSGVLG